MPTLDDGDAGPSWRAALRPFPGQSRGQHLLVAAVGVVLWSATFLATLAGLGGEAVATADAGAAMETRRLAGVVASVAAGAYFGLAVTRERGGPVLNVLYAPVAAAVGATGLPIWVSYGSAPADVFAAPSGAAQLWGGAGEVVVFSTAGATALAVVGTYLAFVAGPAERARIEEHYAPLTGVHTGPPSPDDFPVGDDVETGATAGPGDDD